jgi:hypothetical protein
MKSPFAESKSAFRIAVEILSWPVRGCAPRSHPEGSEVPDELIPDHAEDERWPRCPTRFTSHERAHVGKRMLEGQKQSAILRARTAS